MKPSPRSWNKAAHDNPFALIARIMRGGFFKGGSNVNGVLVQTATDQGLSQRRVSPWFIQS
jgi:hypothetical protein